eukprot:gene3843-2723_t
MHERGETSATNNNPDGRVRSAVWVGANVFFFFVVVVVVSLTCLTLLFPLSHAFLRCYDYYSLLDYSWTSLHPPPSPQSTVSFLLQGEVGGEGERAEFIIIISISIEWIRGSTVP